MALAAWSTSIIMARWKWAPAPATASMWSSWVSGPTLDFGVRHTTIRAMHLDLSDEQTAALTQELHDIIENDRYPLSPRVRTLRAILAKLRPGPVREPLPPPKV